MLINKHKNLWKGGQRLINTFQIFPIQFFFWNKLKLDRKLIYLYKYRSHKIHKSIKSVRIVKCVNGCELNPLWLVGFFRFVKSNMLFLSTYPSIKNEFMSGIVALCPFFYEHILISICLCPCQSPCLSHL